MKRGWQGAVNPFIKPMYKSLENALNIVIYHLARLFIHKTEGAWQLSMYNDFATPANDFITQIGILSGDKEAQTILTQEYESEFGDMGAKLDEFDDLTREVHKVNTTEYNLIWGRTRNRFYLGSYDQRVAALLGLATEMTTQSVPDGVIAVMAYHAEILAKHAAQQSRMSKVDVDINHIYDLRRTLVNKLNKDRGGLLFNFGDLQNCQDLVESYFPLNLLGDRSVRGHYQLIIPHSDFRKVCIHEFDPNERIEATVTGASVWLCLAENADNPQPNGFELQPDHTVIIEPSQLGDLAKKYVIATNVSLTDSCDLIFNILPAVSPG